jgi:hypothetical protein
LGGQGLCWVGELGCAQHLGRPCTSVGYPDLQASVLMYGMCVSMNIGGWLLTYSFWSVQSFVKVVVSVMRCHRLPSAPHMHC